MDNPPEFDEDHGVKACEDSDDFSMTDGSSDVPFTLELWMYPTAIDNHHMLLTKDGQDRTEWIFQYYGYLSYPRFISIMLEDDSSYVYLFAKYYYDFQPNVWYHFMVTYDGSSSLSGLTLYFNGVPVTWTETLDTGYIKMSNTNVPLYRGKFDYPDSKYYQGVLDEVRISKGIARSGGWVYTCYQNQNNPSNFISVGTEETIPFVKTILFGKITNLNTEENYMRFSAIKLRCLRFSPFSLKTYSSNEHFVKLMEAFATLDKLCEHLHLPVQSGSDAVLTRMRRGYSREEYLAKVGQLRERCPEISLSTDIIVGFPGETDDDFSDTLELLAQLEYDETFSFTYSPRPQTVSAKRYEDDVPAAVKNERLQRVLALQREISLAKNRQKIGAIEEILVEGESKLKSGQMMGRTRANQIVNVMGADTLIGSAVAVQITGATANSLIGEPLDPAPSCNSQSEGERA